MMTEDHQYGGGIPVEFSRSDSNVGHSCLEIGSLQHGCSKSVHSLIGILFFKEKICPHCLQRIAWSEREGRLRDINTGEEVYLHRECGEFLKRQMKDLKQAQSQKRAVAKSYAHSLFTSKNDSRIDKNTPTKCCHCLQQIHWGEGDRKFLNANTGDEVCLHKDCRDAFLREAARRQTRSSFMNWFGSKNDNERIRSFNFSSNDSIGSRRGSRRSRSLTRTGSGESRRSLFSLKRAGSGDSRRSYFSLKRKGSTASKKSKKSGRSSSSKKSRKKKPGAKSDGSVTSRKSASSKSSKGSKGSKSGRKKSSASKCATEDPEEVIHSPAGMEPKAEGSELKHEGSKSWRSRRSKHSGK